MNSFYAFILLSFVIVWSCIHCNFYIPGNFLKIFIFFGGLELVVVGFCLPFST